MSKYCKDGELQVFRKHFYDLTIAIQDPDTLAMRLYSEGIITESIRDNVLIPYLSKQMKCTILVTAVETSLKVKPSNFTAFIDILQSDRTLWPIARLLLQTNKCMELQTQNVAPDIRTPGREMSKPNPTKMKFSKVKEHFAYAMTDVIIILHEKKGALARMIVAMDHLQLKEGTEAELLIPGQYDKATSVREFFKLLSSYYGCLDCELVRILVRATHCQPAIDRLQKYLDYLDRVSQDVSLLETSTEDHHKDTPKTEKDTSESSEVTSQEQPSPEASVDVVKQNVALEGSRIGMSGREGSSTPEQQASNEEARVNSPAATVIAKVNEGTFTAKTYEVITRCLSYLWEIPRLAFKYLSAKKNCVIVKWQIPSSLLPLIQSVQVTDEDYQYLASHCITEVHIGDYYRLIVPTVAHSKPETGGTTSVDAGHIASLGAPQTETAPHEGDSTDSKKLEAHLLTMSKRGNLEEVQRLIKSGVRVDCTDETGGTTSVDAGHIASLGAPQTETAPHEGDSTDSKKLEAHLLTMSKRGNLEEVQRLMKSGVRVDCTDESGITPLIWASFYGHLRVVRCLVEAGADVHLPSHGDGFLPLEVASQEGHLKTVEYFISRGAVVNSQNEEGRSPLYAASQTGHPSVVEVLIGAGASVDLQMKNGQSPLYAASRDRHADIGQKLIDAGASVDLQAKNGQSPLFVASWHGYADIVQKLIDAGASVDVQEKNGQSPLFVASQDGHADTVQKLIDAGASVDLQEKEGRSPLWTASFNGHSEVCRILIDAKVDVNLKNENGASPLHVASQEGHKVVVQQLIDSGAFVNSQRTNGLSPLMLASWNGHTHVVDLLIKNGAHTDMRDEEGWSALWLACRHGHIEVAETLISCGADLNLPDQNGSTPVMIAAQNKNREIIELLASSAHADLNIQEMKSGRTALMLAAMDGDLDTVRLLISTGADESITDQNDSTAADIAQAHGHKGVYQELIAHTKTSHTVPIQEQEVSTDMKPEVKEVITELAPEREMRADHEADPERAQMKAEPTAETEVKADPLTPTAKMEEAHPITSVGKVEVEKEEVDKKTVESDKKERIKQTSNYLQTLRQKVEYKLQQLLSTTGVIPRRKGIPAKGTTQGKVTAEVTLIEMDT